MVFGDILLVYKKVMRDVCFIKRLNYQISDDDLMDIVLDDFQRTRPISITDIEW